MNAMIRLPIHIEDVESVTECWTYNRLAIIKTSPYGNDWVASHYNLFVDISNYNFLFGETAMYPVAYYNEILTCEQIPLCITDENNIVDVFKAHLCRGSYIVASIMYDEVSDSVHEVLLFGFDDSQASFLAVALKKKRFVESVISYDYVQKTIRKIKRYFSNNCTAGVKLSLVFQYPVTAMKLNPQYKPRRCPFEAYRKLILEVNSKDIVQNSFFNFEICDDRDYAYIITGVKCLKIFEQMLTEFIENKISSPWFKGVANSAKKMQEHQKMVCLTMEYLADKWQKAMTPQGRQAIEKYKCAIQILDKWTSMCIKFELNNDLSLLRRICEEVDRVYEEELECLLTFVNKGFDWKKITDNYV